MTIREAAELWVRRDMTAVPINVVEKLWQFSDYNDINEVTPPAVGNRVWVDSENSYGEIARISRTESGVKYEVQLDSGDKTILEAEDFYCQVNDYFPMWGTMWSFDDLLDKEWVDNPDNLQKMADCGFRIYESEDYGYLFGIDGAGYNFYEEHWIPLYKARGLKWHEPEE